MSKETFASVIVQTEDGIFHARYSKCLYLSIGNDISDGYEGAVDVTVGIDSEGTNRFKVTCKQAKREEVKRVLIALLRLPHPDFNSEQVFEKLLISDDERIEWVLETYIRP